MMWYESFWGNDKRQLNNNCIEYFFRYYFTILLIIYLFAMTMQLIICALWTLVLIDMVSHYVQTANAEIVYRLRRGWNVILNDVFQYDVFIGFASNFKYSRNI